MGLVARSRARLGRKDVVGEVKGMEMMGVLVAGRGARERGGRGLAWSFFMIGWRLRLTL